ncbi:RagB/SusD family nutrient uptake outer membrane protein [Flavisericum labens]|uniref:RagB/SusD family nutrient uptake outer membrane protein n=1 Tax=Flavisericum labens TaxID=3377112 RepID=UPI00387B7F41
MTSIDNIKTLKSLKWASKVWPLKTLMAIIMATAFWACSEFVEVDPPKNTLVSETVFENPATVESALANLYLDLRDQSMVSGRNGLSSLMGLYSDELDYFLSNTDYSQFYGNVLTPSNSIVTDWWSRAYNIIYAANDIIQGVDGSDALTQDERDGFKGQALFVRAYMHSMLVELFGDIPYVTTTGYVANGSAARMSVSTVHGHIIKDLNLAIALLDADDPTGSRVVPNRDTAKALLARIHLYAEDWEQAASTATGLLTDYGLEPDITKVFLKESPETLWQFRPNGISDMNTYEGSTFIINAIPGQTMALTDALLAAFEPGDQRFVHWVGSHTSDDGLTTLYYAHKYKKTFRDDASTEHSIVFRLSEQYLIRAEARAHLENITGAQDDLNAIRHRAGLGDTSADTQSTLLKAILRERQTELFTEHGQRWFDLKRTGLASDVLAPIKANWQPTDILLPLPEDEISNNPNLRPQNPGY